MRAACKRLAAAALALCASLATADEAALSDIDYRLGQGLRIPGLGLNLGGYVTGTYENLRGRPGRAALDDLSLSAWWEGAGRWKAFAEFDYENTLSSRSARAGEDEADRFLALERVYVDYAVTELGTVRAGKFLTPVGRWNLVHATPLVWTTARPLVTTLAFPTNATGLMFSSTQAVLGQSFEYSLYGSAGQQLRPDPDRQTFRNSLGLRAVAPLPAGVQIGFSFVSFDQENRIDDRQKLYGADLFWSRDGYELAAEGVYRVLHEPGQRNEGGGFVQGVVPLGGRFYAIGRVESYRQTQQTRATRLWLAGLSYRATRAVVVKVEWVGGRNNDTVAREGLLSSISLIF